MSIVTKVTITVLAVILINTISIGVFSYLIHRNDSINIHSNRSIAIAKSAAMSIIPSEFWHALNTNEKNKHYERLQMQFERIKNEESLLYFYAGTFDPEFGMRMYLEGHGNIFGLNGHVPLSIFPQAAFDTFEYGTAHVTDVYRLNIDGTWGISAYAPIFGENYETIGLIGVLISLKEPLSRSDDFALTIMIMSLLSFIIISWIFVFYIRKTVAKPLFSLQVASTKIAQGEMDIQIPIIKADDEIGVLSKNFYIMQKIVFSMQSEIKTIAKNVTKGNLSYRAQTDKYPGEWHEVAILLNTLIGTIESYVTAMKTIEVEREQALKQATAASRAKSDFLASMSHEMRTPMNAIIGMTAIGKKADDMEKKNYTLNKIEEASSHLLNVINDVLDMAKIEADKLELSPIEYNFERMLQKVLTIVNFKVDEKQQRLTWNIDKNVPRFLIGDEQRLAQVITNLMSNAVKFTPEGGEISLEVFLVFETEGNCELRIEVKDSGIGISAEQKERLFRAFEQAEGGTCRQYGGTGLGLTISKRIIELMGGNIWVESELGKGATFIFTAKARRCDKSLGSMLAPGVNWKNVRIMAVDDIAETRDQIQDIFWQLDINCDVAADAFEACRIIEERGAYDIYFIDWRMPGMDGLELTRKIRESTASKLSVVIMITAMDWEQIREEALQAGVKKCLLKPLTSSTIIDCVNETFGISDEITDNNTISIGEFGGKNILIVEDVEINREILITLLEGTGLAIDCAENGEEALTMIGATLDKYDLVFMDVQMPIMNGLEATRRIRALPERQRGRLPIIALTANVFSNDIKDCLAAGMDDHLGKPFAIDRVMEKLRAYLR